MVADASDGYWALILLYLPSSGFFSSSWSVCSLSFWVAVLTLPDVTCFKATDVLTPW